jgi:ParB-like chromosome segregation protein Spo0J
MTDTNPAAKPADTLRRQYSAERQEETKPLEFHPIANIFPMLEDESVGFEALVDDIKARHQQDQIVTYEGKILDGRNRYRACKQLGITALLIREYHGEDPVGFVLSANLHRRHLNEAQRALVAAKLANLGVGANQNSEGTSIEVAAKALSISRASVERAKVILTKGDPSLIEAVQQGAVSLAAGAQAAQANTGDANSGSNGAQPAGRGSGTQNLSDQVDDLAKSLIKKLKKLKQESGADTAIAAAAKLVEDLKTADLIVEERGRKKAA